MTDQIMTDMSNDFFGSSAAEEVRENARRNARMIEDKEQAEYVAKAAQRAKTVEQAQEVLDYSNHAIAYQNKK